VELFFGHTLTKAKRQHIVGYLLIFLFDFIESPFLTFFDHFGVFFSKRHLFWVIDHADSKKIVYFNRQPPILKIFDIFQKMKISFPQKSQY
jgi:hypothetical protein